VPASRRARRRPWRPLEQLTGRAAVCNPQPGRPGARMPATAVSSAGEQL